MPEPAGTFGIVTWPFASVVEPAVIVPVMFPPVTVTVAPRARAMLAALDGHHDRSDRHRDRDGVTVLPPTAVAETAADVWPPLVAVRL